MFQSWRELTFLHWRYAADIVERQVPAPLEVETFDGSAWVGVIPFRIVGLRPAALPALPWISTFSETNCRTYVKGPDGTAGVWFFSLDAARAAAVAAARLGYGLPYAWSRMRVTSLTTGTARQMRYESKRRWPDARTMTDIVVEEGDAIEPGALEIFLTARFRLYSFLRGHLTYTSVQHAPWPLQAARVIRVEQTLTAAAGLPDPVGTPLAQFSPGVDVRVAAPKRGQELGSLETGP
jgi:uncharacterized protein YqjF (DUF2071 family)